MKASNESSSGGLVCLQGDPDSTGNAPYINVEYVSVIGTPGYATTIDHAIDDHEGLHVNVSSGNLNVTSTEFSSAGPGVPLSIARAYNSLADFTSLAMIGIRWTLTPGDTGGDYFQDTGHYSNYNSISFGAGADGYAAYVHPRNYANITNREFADPLGDNLTATRDAGDSWFVTDHRTHLTAKYLGSNDHMLDSITDPHGLSETVAYSSDVCWCYGDHFVASVTGTSGRVYTYSHDVGNGRITGITGPVVGGSAQSTAYTQVSGQLTDARDTFGKHTTYAYDGSGRMISITSPAGRKVLLSYDSSNRVQNILYVTNGTSCTVSTPSSCVGNSYSFAYTAPASFGATGTTVVTDPKSHTTTYTWGAMGRVTQAKDALNRTRQSTYTPNGDRATLTDNLSAVSTLTHDAANNLTQLQSPTLGGGGAGRTSSTAYTLATDALGHYTPGSYNAMSSTDAQGKMTTYTYNTTNDLSTVTPPSGIGGSALANHYQGETGITCSGKAGQLCSSVDGNGHTTSYTYDSAGNPTTVTPPAPLGASTNTFDAAGHVGTHTDALSNVTRYTYDIAGHLTKLQFGGITTCTSTDISAGNCVTYAYDDDGNLLTRVDARGTSSFTYDYAGAPLSKSIPGSTTSTVTYDTAGNIATYADAGGTVTYAYNNANDVTSLAEPGGSCSGTISRCTMFGYDGAGRRNLTTYPSGESVAVGYDTGGRTTSITAKRPSGTTFFSRSLGYQTGAPADSGLVQTSTDSPGSTTTNTYDGYSRLTQSVVRYATSIYDTTTGLSKLGQRYYNPTLGRWTQKDTTSFTITDPGQLNGYTYVSDNPMSNVDPSGQSLFGDLGDALSDATDAVVSAAQNPTVRKVASSIYGCVKTGAQAESLAPQHQLRAALPLAWSGVSCLPLSVVATELHTQTQVNPLVFRCCEGGIRLDRRDTNRH